MGKFFDRFQIIVALPPKVLGDLRKLVGPARRREGHAAALRHVAAGLHVVHHEELIGTKVIAFHDVQERIGRRLPGLRGQVAGKDAVRFKAEALPVVPEDVLVSGVGGDADEAALRPQAVQKRTSSTSGAPQL